MNNKTSLVFKVTRQTPELITPAAPTRYEFKELSDIDDQPGLWMRVPGIQFYRSAPSMLGADPARVIKKAVSKALVPFYPLAGRLRKAEGNKLVVECTAEGVMFTEADAEVSLDEFSEAQLHPPIPCIDELLYDDFDGYYGILNSPLVLIQVTRLKCGGFILAHKINHVMADGLGLAQFLNAVGELARGARFLSVYPIWKRDLIRARDPPQVTCEHPEFDQIPDIPFGDDLIHKAFFFGVLDEELAQEDFFEAFNSVGPDGICKIVESQFTPYVGQQFSELEEAIRFYKLYGLSIGFDVRKYTTKRWKDGTIKSKLLVCNRQGHKYVNKENLEKVKERPNIESQEISDEEKSRRNTKITRVECQARLRLHMLNGLLVVDDFKKEHNHDLVDVYDREFQKMSRRLHKYHKQLIVYNSRLKLGATKTYKMCKEYSNGFENIGASLTDFKNFERDIKCYINERDGQLFVERFKNMAETREDFYFDYEVDTDKSLVRAVWFDGIGRRNYSVFGDCLSFDPTYGTNKYKMVFTPFTGVDNHKRTVTFGGALLFRENEESFSWVFRHFLQAMGGKEPEYIITDQDPGIIKSVGTVFKTARHRFCMWHIMNKVPNKYGCTRKDCPEFLKKLNSIVWDEEIEGDDFDSKWCEIMSEHEIGKELEWFQEIYSKRNQWVMAHCRDLKMGGAMRTTQRSESVNSFFKKFESSAGLLVEFWSRYESAIDQQRHTHKKLDSENKHKTPQLKTQSPLESHAAKVYTHDVFGEFQSEIILSANGLIARGFSEVNGVEATKVKDGHMDKLFDVQYNPGTYETSCTCTMFERTGILCRHIFWIYSSHGLKEIPGKYVATRWTKDALRVTCSNMDIIDGREIEMTKLWSEIYETIGLLKSKEKTDVENLCNLIREFRVTIAPVSEELSKSQEIEQLLGCKPINEITILPPKQAKNKGSGKRMLSCKAKAVAKAAKPKRMCNNCKQMGHHDKRNCPHPFAKHPPADVETPSLDEEGIEDEESDSDLDK